MSTTTLPRCTACDGSEVRRDPFYHDWNGRRFWIYRCATCTHQFVHPSVTPEDQSRIYGDEYFSETGDWVCGIFRGGYVDAEAQLREEAQQILAIVPASCGRLLDVGCAGGVFLDEARRRGFEVAGIELNPTMAEHARSKYHLDVLVSRIEAAPDRRWAEEFDVVTVLDCLEHVPEPLTAMKKIAGWLRPGGVVLVRGPLSNSRLSLFKDYARRLLGIAKRLPGYPLDANMFNKRSLTRLLDLSGFESTTWIGETASFANTVARRRH